MIHQTWNDKTGRWEPQTNGDKIRAMSDADLANWIRENIGYTCDLCIPKMRTEKKCDGHCRAGILNYLRQGATE